MMTKVRVLFTGIFLLALLFWISPATAAEKCLDCHKGIEKISESNQAHNALPCATCHMGDPNATTEKAAHKGMFANPGDLRVVDKTCGLCHAADVKVVKTSLHATMAGQISGTRYAAGAQGREGIYAVADVSNPDSKGKHAIKSLKKIPRYDPSKPEGPDNHLVDDYLRNQCLRCHLWSSGHERDGDYRASGCSACHVVYSDKGTYEGGDQAIDKKKKGRPKLHRITRKIPEYQCLHCHNRGGRTGVSFIGTMESDGYGSPWTKTGGKQGKLHGKNYNKLAADIHYQKGMTCIDCHTKQDMHGDGNLYVKKWQAVEIECEDCHGTLNKRSNLKSSWGNPLTNLKEKDGNIVLTSKMDGKERIVPQVAGAKLTGEGHTAMVAIPVHMQKLECYACHAKWAPQCYGCHAKQDIGKKSGDWVNPKPGGDPSKAGKKGNRQNTAFAWNETRSYLRWETPVLGINSEGKVSPFVPGCQVFFSQMKGKKNIINNKVYKTKDGTSGLAHNPIQPHTISKESRSCADCHMSAKAIGLGSGFWKSKANGLPNDFELERIVDEEGKQIQATSHVGARPFNKAEQQRIRRSGTCVACHGADQKLWAKAQGKAGMKAPTDEMHQKAIQNLLK